MKKSTNIRKKFKLLVISPFARLTSRTRTRSLSRVYEAFPTGMRWPACIWHLAARSSVDMGARMRDRVPKQKQPEIVPKLIPISFSFHKYNVPSTYGPLTVCQISALPGKRFLKYSRPTFCWVLDSRMWVHG